MHEFTCESPLTYQQWSLFNVTITGYKVSRVISHASFHRMNIHFPLTTRSHQSTASRNSIDYNRYRARRTRRFPSLDQNLLFLSQSSSHPFTIYPGMKAAGAAAFANLSHPPNGVVKARESRYFYGIAIDGCPCAWKNEWRRTLPVLFLRIVIDQMKQQGSD